MNYTIVGKNIDVSDKLREKVSSKIDRISKLFDKDTTATVTISQEKLSYKIEVTVPLKKRTLRAEVQNQEFTTALDQVVDVVEKQVVKYKNRLRDRSRHDHSLRDEFVTTFDKAELDEPVEASKKIEKIKKFEIKPMDAEEAVMEMELMDHSFFVYRNGKTDLVNVVYRRNNGTYGLIEPEY